MFTLTLILLFKQGSYTFTQSFPNTDSIMIHRWLLCAYLLTNILVPSKLILDRMQSIVGMGK